MPDTSYQLEEEKAKEKNTSICAHITVIICLPTESDPSFLWISCNGRNEMRDLVSGLLRGIFPRVISGDSYMENNNNNN